jgi:Leucine-rich repeat (LRR) protein
LVITFSGFYLQFIGSLKQLTYLDVSKNNIEMVEEGISACENLQDLLLSSNSLQQLPETLGLYCFQIQIFFFVIFTFTHMCKHCLSFLSQLPDRTCSALWLSDFVENIRDNREFC